MEPERAAIDSFRHKSILVAGGASGIGRAVADILAARGASVAILDRDRAAGAEAAAAMAEAGGRVCFEATDVASADEVMRAVDVVRAAQGPIDAAIFCAGVQRYGNALTTTLDEWREVMDINLAGAWHLARACLPDLRARRGAIVIVSSVQGLATQENVLAYAVSKHGLIGLARSIAVDFGAEGVRANVVCPGTVDTPMLRASAARDPSPQSMIDACIDMHPVKRIARPEEIAEVIAFLAHERASFVNGAVWTVDGGLLARIGGAPRTA